MEHACAVRTIILDDFFTTEGGTSKWEVILSTFAAILASAVMTRLQILDISLSGVKISQNSLAPIAGSTYSLHLSFTLSEEDDLRFFINRRDIISLSITCAPLRSEISHPTPVVPSSRDTLERLSLKNYPHCVFTHLPPVLPKLHTLNIRLTLGIIPLDYDVTSRLPALRSLTPSACDRRWSTRLSNKDRISRLTYLSTSSAHLGAVFQMGAQLHAINRAQRYWNAQVNVNLNDLASSLEYLGLTIRAYMIPEFVAH